MNNDQILVIGIILCALSLPSLLAAYSENRAPRTGAIMLLVGGVLLVVALMRKPTGYSFDEIPHIFVSVIAGLLN